MPHNIIEKPFEHMTGDRHVGNTVKNHFIAATGEFVGTFFFLFFAFACQLMAFNQAPNKAPNGSVSSSTVVYIALGYGMSLLVAVWILFRISGGLFNPAVTFGMVLAGQLPWVRGLVLFPAQILGGVVAAALVSCMLPGDIAATRTVLAPGMSHAQGLFFEMFLTSFLVFTVLMLAAEKSKTTFLAPIGIGLALFVAELAGVYYTGGSLNPARSFGPCVAAANFNGGHYLYWIGPLLGGALAAGYYRFCKWFKYEEANPDQDHAGADEVV
ncbi:aquaporin-like protein [Aureobasidium pullulans]|uniref:Aquaporin-like protein n=1 Tax=Aureobasidium pullulans TaxID=5580 RepID=A0A4S9Y7E6_AURPU|nr:aquaporin-like protein [Aureobasidium pullulans]THZ44894.1 aquaporin-like protein [Aureobasidium pullulans]THZ61423.1 aquaporin-like protein [Aureobasidium pullulans]THZ87133.1 aquaporin-like protein [Aureobasidium pullulans]